MKTKPEIVEKINELRDEIQDLGIKNSKLAGGDDAIVREISSLYSQISILQWVSDEL